MTLNCASLFAGVGGIDRYVVFATVWVIGPVPYFGLEAAVFTGCIFCFCHKVYPPVIEKWVQKRHPCQSASGMI